MKRKSLLVSVLSLFLMGGALLGFENAKTISATFADETNNISTIGDVLNTVDFPTTKEEAWTSYNGDFMYIETVDEVLNLRMLDTSGVPCPIVALSETVTPCNEGFTYEDTSDFNMYVLTFYMTDNKLTEIYFMANLSQASGLQGRYYPKSEINVVIDSEDGSVDSTISKNADGFNINITYDHSLQIYESKGLSYIELHYLNLANKDSLLNIKYVETDCSHYDHLEYSLDGVTYVTPTYNEYNEEIDDNYINITNINHGIDIKLIFSHTYKATHSASDASCLEAGHQAYYECECGYYFADEDCINKIGDASALSDWLSEDGEGYIAPTGHHFSGEITYIWNDDKCTASWKCDHDGCNETQTETVEGVYVKDTDATCTADEKGHYEATFTISEFGTKSTLANSVQKGGTAKGHDVTITYTWNENHTKCVAEATCTHGDYSDSEEATATIENGVAIAAFNNKSYETQYYTFPAKEGLSGGAIAGIVIGSVAGVGLIAFVLIFYLKKKAIK